MNLALLAAAATGVQVGAAIVATRYVVAEVPPLTLALLRYAIGVATLLPFAWHALRNGRRWPQARSQCKNQSRRKMRTNAAASRMRAALPGGSPQR